ncbi:MAG: AMP-binding protein [Pseudomonas sp.]
MSCCVAWLNSRRQSVSARWLEVTGCPILEGYGLSETSPTATLNAATATAFSGTLGLPVPSTDVAILGKILRRELRDKALPVGA